MNQVGSREVGLEVIVMQRRFARDGVLVSLLPRFGRISVVKVEVDEDLRGQGHFRRVMAEICGWADSYGYVLGATPSTTWGADVNRMTTFLTALGFDPNPELNTPDALTRMPRDGLGGEAP